MITLRATAESLGSAGPDIHSAIEDGVDAGPVVLWSGREPAAVLTLTTREREQRGRIRHRLERVGGSQPARRGAFPLELEATRRKDQDDSHLDRLGDHFTADLDGDGTDELVLVRRFGGVQVAGLDRVRAELPSPTTPEVAYYLLRQGQRVREAGRDALYLLFERYASGITGRTSRATPGAPDPFRLLRVDAAGIRAVPLADPVPEPSGFAVFTRPDGALDAIAVFGWDGPESGLLATLHDGEGRRIGGPWNPPKIPSAPSGFHRVVTAPGGRLAAASLGADGGNLWLFDFSKGALRAGFAHLEGSAVPFHVAAGGPEPLVLATGEAWSWALDREARPWHRPDGAWKRCPPKRWVEVEVEAPGDGYRRPQVFPSEDGSDQYLVVHTRPRHDRKLSHAALLAAAERFLPETEVADLEALVPPARGAKKDDDGRFSDFDREVAERLTWPLRHPEAVTSARYRNPEPFRAWLAENDLHARTVFTLVRAGRVHARFEVAGYHDDDERSEVGASQVAWRADGDGVAVVLSLKTADTNDPRAEEARFHVVRAAPEPRSR